jgi:hypothetical protein
MVLSFGMVKAKFHYARANPYGLSVMWDKLHTLLSSAQEESSQQHTDDFIPRLIALIPIWSYELVWISFQGSYQQFYPTNPIHIEWMCKGGS